jgi:SpoIID/LytB domain protein
MQYWSGTWGTWAPNGKSSWTGPLQFEGVPVLRLNLANGSARDYRTALRAVRTGTSTIDVVNALDLESYLYGVVPRESPASWHAEALKAQAVAARSYSAYKLDHAPSGAAYDICSTTQCQVYGGVRYVSSGGTVTELESASTNAAVDATKGVTRTYGGKAAFTEFSSSNGGWSTQGSMPYLAPSADPWDEIASPHHYWTATLTASQIEARYPSVGHLLRLRVTSRDGNGDWGGRVKTVVLEGVDANGNATTVNATGGGIYLANTWPTHADGLRGSWWHILPSYAAVVVSKSANPALVKPPGAATTNLVVTYRNTGTVAWPVASTHLVVANPLGGSDPMAGGSKIPGSYTGSATSIAPGDSATFVVHLDASRVAAGTYTKAYVLQIGADPVFGQVAQWSVTVAEPVFSSALVGFAGTAAAPTNGAPPNVWSDGTVVLPRTGAVSLTVKVRNTGNVTWPLNGNVMLAPSDPRYRESASYGPEWKSTSRVGPATAVDGVTGATGVKPGQVAVFPMTLHGNGVAGGLTEESFEPAWFGWAWLTGAKLRLHVVRVDTAVSRAAQLVSQTAPLSLLAYPGDKSTLTIRLRNIGGTAWPVNGTDVMGTANPTDRIDALRTPAWASSTRATRLAANVSRPASTAVYPGEVGEYRIPIDPTNRSAQTYGEWFRAFSGAFYGPVAGTSVTVGNATLSATVTRNTTGLKVSRTGVGTYVVELKNTGNTTWKVASSMRLSTATASPSHTTAWITSTRPCAITLNVTHPGALSVKPGEVARFSFQIGGNGRAAGTYTEYFGAGWEAWRSTGLRIPITYVLS